MYITVTSEYDGMLVRDYLRKSLGISRAELTELKKRDEGIVLNGKRVTVRALLKDGDILSLDRDDIDSSKNIVPTPYPVDILFEDDDIIAVNKPPNMPTHPSHDHFSDTLANALVYYFEKKGVHFVFRAVNRLDRDTSGIVLVAKNRSAAFKLSKQIASFEVKKTYIAIANGLADNKGVIEANIRRKNESLITREVCPDNDGQYALTEYETLEQREIYSILSVTPKTGRTHQIRLHLSHIGHPIIGDTLYGDEKNNHGIRRQALHAYSLEFMHPVTSKIIKITAPPPEDMLKLMSAEIRDILCRK